MAECTGLYFSENTTYKEVAFFDRADFTKGITLYEVIRMEQGVCLFLEDHLQRLQESIRLSGIDYPIDFSWLYNTLTGLVRLNQLALGNIKIVILFPSIGQPAIYSYFIPHSYPTPELYHNGVDTALYLTVRMNPNIKRHLPELRERTTDFIRTEQVYEALLVNAENKITEGSKTNVFFIQGELIFTPPGNEVLKGITREKIFELCNLLNFKLIESPISTDKLNQMDAAFLTGTSPKILPVRRIGSITYPTDNRIIIALIKAYDNLIAGYINRQNSH